MEPQTADWIAYKAKRRADISMYFALVGLFIFPILAPLIGMFLGNDSLQELKMLKQGGYSVDPKAIKQAQGAIAGNLIVLMLGIVATIIVVATFA